MGHISDRTLDNLLDGSIDDETELAIEEHVRHCNRCAQRLREWELLFPQVRSLMPTGERPVAAPSPDAAFATVRGPAVYVPDWSPPPSHHTISSRLAWGLVIVLAIGAGYVIYQKTARESPTIGVLLESHEMTAEATGDSAGLGSGIPATSSVPLPSVDAARIEQESLLARAEAIRLAQAAKDSAAALALSPAPAPAEPPPATVASREQVEQDVRRPPANREAPVTFPIKVDPATRQGEQTTATRDSNPTTPPTSLPAQFQRVSLGEAISHLAGTVRLIQGLNPEAVEIAQGSALPGADPGKAVVRVVYNAPEGRLIMDQQRLGRGGRSEPNIAISTAPNGVSVAQWVDRGGFWISLAGRADQQTLLALANRIR